MLSRQGNTKVLISLRCSAIDLCIYFSHRIKVGFHIMLSWLQRKMAVASFTSDFLVQSRSTTTKGMKFSARLSIK